jgi:hypothetical protein
VEQLEEYLLDPIILENIRTAMNGFTLKLHNKAKVKPFVDGFENPDESTKDMIPDYLPLKKSKLKNLLKTPYTVSELVRNSDHFDEVMYAEWEADGRKFNVELDGLKMSVLDKQSKIESVRRFSSRAKTPDQAYKIAMALFNQSSVEGKMFMMDKNKQHEMDDVEFSDDESASDTEEDDGFFDYMKENSEE